MSVRSAPARLTIERLKFRSQRHSDQYGSALTADIPTTDIADVAALTNGFRFDIGMGPTEGTLGIRCRCCSEPRTDAGEDGLKSNVSIARTYS